MGRRVLGPDRRCELFEETIGLFEEMRDTRVLCLSKQLEICLFIVGLESLETLLSSAFNTLLLLLLNVLVSLKHEAAKLLNSCLIIQAMLPNFLTVLCDGLEELILLVPLL